MKRKGLAVGIILLFVGTCIIPATAQNRENPWLPASRGHWLYVGGNGPGNYTRIRDAINNASDGDSVFVFDDSSPYYERVKINKSIHLIGENRETTVIDGQDSLTAVSMTADEATITGFTIHNTGFFLSMGLFVQSNHTTIIGNTIIGNIFSNTIMIDIYLTNSHDNIIKENTASSGSIGIGLSASDDTTITGNTITENRFYGIILANSRRNIISKNNIMENGIHDAFFERDLGILPLSNHWDANYWGRPYFFPKPILGKLILLEKHPSVTLPLVNFDWHPAQQPYDIPGMR